jgi:hypothetical protein
METPPRGVEGANPLIMGLASDAPTRETKVVIRDLSSERDPADDRRGDREQREVEHEARDGERHAPRARRRREVRKRRRRIVAVDLEAAPSAMR